jgi:iron-binding CDGSH zinc finger protein
MSELASESSAQRARNRVQITGEGPVLVYGAADIVTPDGATVRSERAVTALCTCRRSRRFPFCDTSHRDRERRRRPGAEK